MRLLLLLLIAVVCAPGCESCEFTYGSIEVSGTLVIKGPEPADLRIAACYGPGPDNCGGEYADGSITSGTDRRYEYVAWIPSEGTWSCGFERHWIVVTGTSCTETAIDALAVGPGATVQPQVQLDLELHCTVTL
jgi:hypothetical protein